MYRGTGALAGALDQIVVRRNSGALVRASTSSGGDGALTLVTDSGQRFAVPTRDAATALRYDPAGARSVPAPFVRLLPASPVLDPEVAAQFPDR
ncbi:type VII secretion protein EccB [Pseudonocardia sp. H11422]|uniref:type VII secretion protein EccB n=1 Tax=Pseudonocardia sp. H11422 TaxID=2835866 RepID=UPI001BDD738C|nr:type VII secretion protein EccB [Pseudonocardia sp. H11422]